MIRNRPVCFGCTLALFMIQYLIELSAVTFPTTRLADTCSRLEDMTTSPLIAFCKLIKLDRMTSSSLEIYDDYAFRT